jgi:vacuolar-type H+-ATPase subunit E/Vma4
MPLEHILRAMQAQADAEIEKISRTADEEIAQLIAEAEAAAVAIRARHRARVEPMLVAEVAGFQNKAKLGALRATANAREQLIAEAFAQAQDCLAQIRASKPYAAILRALAHEAAQALDSDLIARTDPRDVEIARAAFADPAIGARGVTVEIETQPIPLGGLEVLTRDGRIVMVNTLAARLERARDVLRGPVARILTAPPAPSPESKIEETRFLGENGFLRQTAGG